MNNGQGICRDAELAHDEQGRLDLLRNQAERDREYAENLAVGRERTVINRRRRQETQLLISEGSDTESQADDRIASLFGMCVQTCSDNKVNVAKAFQTGKVKPIFPIKAGDEKFMGEKIVLISQRGCEFDILWIYSSLCCRSHCN